MFRPLALLFALNAMTIPTDAELIARRLALDVIDDEVNEAMEDLRPIVQGCVVSVGRACIESIGRIIVNSMSRDNNTAVTAPSTASTTLLPTSTCTPPVSGAPTQEYLDEVTELHLNISSRMDQMLYEASAFGSDIKKGKITSFQDSLNTFISGSINKYIQILDYFGSGSPVGYNIKSRLVELSKFGTLVFKKIDSPGKWDQYTAELKAAIQSFRRALRLR